MNKITNLFCIVASLGFVTSSLSAQYRDITFNPTQFPGGTVGGSTEDDFNPNDTPLFSQNYTSDDGLVEMTISLQAVNKNSDRFSAGFDDTDNVGNPDLTVRSDDLTADPATTNWAVFRFEFFDSNSNPLTGDYRVFLYDIDYRDNNGSGSRQEFVGYDSSNGSPIPTVLRFDNDSVTTTTASDTLGVLNPDGTKGSYIEPQGTSSINSSNFETFAGLANFTGVNGNEEASTAPAQGAISFGYSNVDSFDLVMGNLGVPNGNGGFDDLTAGARFILDFNNPPDSIFVASAIPEPSTYLAGFIVLSFILGQLIYRSHRRRRQVTVAAKSEA